MVNVFVIYRAEKKIKHCRIKVEGRLYTFGSVQFESLVELISYYERHPLYKKVKLWYPVSEEVAQRSAGLLVNVLLYLYYLVISKHIEI